MLGFPLRVGTTRKFQLGMINGDLKTSSLIKNLAKKYDIALVVIAALRKAGNLKDSKGVTIDDIIGAGRLVYDCTSCWFVESEQEWGNPPSGTIKVKCLKSRFSGAAALGEVVELHWSPHTGQVSDLRYHE